MSFVKITGEGSGEAAAEGLAQGVAQTAAQGLAQGAADAGGKAVQQVTAVAGGAVQAATAIVGASQAGAAGAALGGVAGIAGGIAGTGAAGGIGGAVGGGVGGAAGGVAGAVGGVAGAAAGAAGNVAGAVGGLAGGAASGVVGAVGGLAGGAPGSMTGAVSGIAGAAAGAADQIGGAAGGLAGAAKAGLPAGGIAGIAGGVPGGISGIIPDGELPFFEDKAITTAVGKAAQALDGAAGAVGAAGSANLEVEVASGDDLDIRNFSAHERMSSLFQINLIATSDNSSIDFDAVAGKFARFAVHAGAQDRSWAGLCNHIEQIRVEPSGASTYQISIVPDLWLLTQRKNYRMFQQLSEPEIVLEILKEWDIEPEVRIDQAAYKKRKYRVQYAESDFAFISRLLEDAGIAYHFEQDGEETKLVLSDSPHTNPQRDRPLSFVDDTSTAKKNDNEVVTAVRLSQRVRPGKVTLRDHDYRRPPNYKLIGTAAGGLDAESRLERYHYTPGALLVRTDQGESTPVADDRGRARTDEREGNILAQKRLNAKRSSARVCTFETNAHDLAPGMVVTFSNHPHEALGEGKKLLIVESSFNGTESGEWSHHCEARSTDVPFRPELVTPRPKVNGVESATVVGPSGEEIHTDEFGRVRVHFHWDRDSKMDQNSSCWIHVSQPWAGAGYGGTNLPRVGQEVLVDFLSGDPDRPVIVGRVYTNLQKTPYKLPDNKTQSGWKSNSTGGTGGYNEIMFDDAGGRELFRMQAEKDHQTLVKNDEQGRIGNNRSKSIGNDDSMSIGNNRSSMVGSNNSEVVGGDESVTVGANQTVTVGGTQTVTVDGSHLVTVKGQGTFPGSHTDVTGQFKVTASKTAYVSAPNKITLECPGSSITLEPGKITLKAGGNAEIVLDANALMKSAAGSKVFLDANAQMKSSGNSEVLLDANALTQSSGGSKVLLDGSALMSSPGTATVTAPTATLAGGGGSVEADGAGVTCAGSQVNVSGGMVNVSGSVVKIN